MKDNYAFPHITSTGNNAPGMELRDWFASKAMQSLIVADIDSYHMSPSNICLYAYEVADKMMAARERKG